MSLLDPADWTASVYSTKWQPARGGEAAVVEPATGTELGRIGLASAEQVAVAAAAAASAQPAWAATSFEERAAVVRRAARLLEDNAPEIQDWLKREAGVTAGMAEFTLHLTVQMCYEAAVLPSQPLGQILPSAGRPLSLARRVPAGVVGVISPFNAPTVLAMRSVAPALALGNAVVLKPDPRTSVVGGALFASLFAAAGLPPGVLHVLPGQGDVGEALIADPRVRVISFTGSTFTGRKVAELAARHLTRAHLELGGNSALIILDDVDLDRAVSAGAWASFLHQGQICMAAGRHLVHASLFDEYVSRLSAKAARLAVGDPFVADVALGPLIDAQQRDRVHSLVTSAVAAGARLAAGGTYEDLFYRPTVLSDVTTSMPVYEQEVFGPVAPVLPFGSASEAVDLSAASPYGLSLGILTRDPLRALSLAERIPTGIVHINDQTVDDQQVVPFGGVGVSGTGSRFGGTAANIEAFTETQWVTLQSEIPPYPF